MRKRMSEEGPGDRRGINKKGYRYVVDAIRKHASRAVCAPRYVLTVSLKCLNDELIFEVRTTIRTYERKNSDGKKIYERQ